ncbi:ABC transporter permease [Neobacillus sp. NPDC097160]|uniref:ABC transporter permease n=1 Tax=Neobacillus sp. NPDC097160 TaxID=3364298 RepID=UPI00380A462E
MSIVPNTTNNDNSSQIFLNEENEELVKVKEPGLLWYLFRRKTVVVGFLFFLLVLLCALLAPFLTSYLPSEMDVENRLAAPSTEHFFGTDNFGRDVFSRVIHGGRASLLVGTSVVILAVGLGSLIGLVCGYYKKVDAILMRIVDGLMSFPGLILAIAMMGVLGSGVFTVIIALSIVYFPRVARVVRGSVLVISESPLVEAEKSLGANGPYILLKHILPNCLSPIIVQTTFIFSYAILGEAALSFLGVGVPPTIPSWGNILSDSRVFIVQGWWMAVFPGLAIMVTVLGLNQFGDGLRDTMDPKSRRF